MDIASTQTISLHLQPSFHPTLVTVWLMLLAPADVMQWSFANKVQLAIITNTNQFSHFKDNQIWYFSHYLCAAEFGLQPFSHCPLLQAGIGPSTGCLTYDLLIITRQQFHF